jgi:hypothetical protein
MRGTLRAARSLRVDHRRGLHRPRAKPWAGAAPNIVILIADDLGNGGELYDLELDPSARDNRASEEREVVARL